METKTKLPARVEKLLIKVTDGEGSIVERGMVSFLTTAHAGCRDFCRDMKLVGEKVRLLEQDAAPQNSVDLWSKIERRIEAEERAAIYLGQREVSTSESQTGASWLSEIFNPSVFGGMAVGVATAAVAFFVFKPGTGPLNQFDSSQEIRIANNSIISEQPPVELVSFSKNKKANVDNREAFKNQRQVRLLRRMNPRIPFEVDWLKSDGKVSFIQDPSQGSTVIWVKRNEGVNEPKVLEAEPRILETAR